MNTADNAFILLCAALVMFMTPGLALFYAGMARAKNVLGTAMQSFIMLGLISVLWAVLGYTLAFGPDHGGLVGGLDYLFLRGVGLGNNGPVSNLPHITFMIYQCMFAVITPALITGAMAERVRFTPLLAFSSLWLILVYCPLAHWVWGGGWMQKFGVLDFAGGAVVHVSCASAALAAALATGKRQGWGKQAFIPHSLPLTIAGMGILWFGWFGFNAGSALAANDIAANAFVTTHFAAAAGTLTWLVVEAMTTGKATTLGAVSGAVAGLGAITPASGFVTPMNGMLIGGLSGIICYGGVLLKNRFGYDDSLDVVGIHGVGGTWGLLAAGLLASVNGATGMFYGNAGQFVIQLTAVVVTWGFCFLASFALLKLVDALMGLRVSADDELRGLDISQHNEAGYQL